MSERTPTEGWLDLRALRASERIMDAVEQARLDFRMWPDVRLQARIQIEIRAALDEVTGGGRQPWVSAFLRPRRRTKIEWQRVGKARAGRLLDGVEHNAFPEG